MLPGRRPWGTWDTQEGTSKRELQEVWNSVAWAWAGGARHIGVISWQRLSREEGGARTYGIYFLYRLGSREEAKHTSCLDSLHPLVWSSRDHRILFLWRLAGSHEGLPAHSLGCQSLSLKWGDWGSSGGPSFPDSLLTWSICGLLTLQLIVPAFISLRIWVGRKGLGILGVLLKQELSDPRVRQLAEFYSFWCQSS